jgi:putative ABC transport system permease protein
VLFSSAETNVEPEGYRSANPRDLHAWYDPVGPHYFSTIGAHLIAGRDFDERDVAGAPKVMIVNEEFARFFFGGRNPIGRNVAVLEDEQTKAKWQIVGVVKDMRDNGDIRRQPRRYFYLPAPQMKEPLFEPRFLIRSSGNPASLASAVRAAVRAEDPQLPVVSIDTAVDLLHRTLSEDRLIASLSAVFGVLALLLATIGIYGLLSYEAARRTGEIGIRMALGATRGEVIRMMLAEVALVALCGICAGAAASLAAGKFVSGRVFGLKPSDPAVLAGAAAVLIGAARCAGFWPARRASRLDPMTALRRE